MSDETTNETTEDEQPDQPEQARAAEPAEIPSAGPEESTEPEPELEPAAEAETAETESAAEASELATAAEQAEPQAEPAAEAEGGATSAQDLEVLEVLETGKRQRSRKHVPRSARRTRTKTRREQAAARKPIVRLEKPEHERGRRQERRGVVVSDAMNKTIVVKVDTVKSHRRYKKVIRRSVKFHAHDEQNQAHVGDVVRIVETRPLSKTKNWRLAEILEAAK